MVQVAYRKDNIEVGLGDCCSKEKIRERGYSYEDNILVAKGELRLLLVLLSI